MKPRAKQLGVDDDRYAEMLRAQGGGRLTRGPGHERVIAGALSYDEFHAEWEAMTEVQRQLVRDKAVWEHMSLWAVLNEWPSLRASAGSTERKAG